MKTFFIIALVFLSATPTFAGPFSKRRSSSQVSTPVYSYTSNNLGGNSDQQRCEQEANYMASHSITGHVGSTIGSFEGVGYGSSPNPNTCTPGRNMSLTGDATARGYNGMYYRVRSWR